MSVLTTSNNGNGRKTDSRNEIIVNHPSRPYSPRTGPAKSLHSEQLDYSAWLASLLIVIACTTTLSAEDARTEADLRAKLMTPITISLRDNPVRDSLQRLAETQAIAVFVDRRIDPTAELTLDANARPLDEVFRDVAKQRNLGIGTVGPVVYVGPPMTAARVATLAALRNQQAAELKPKLRKKMLTKQALTWTRLSEPRWIVRKLCAEAGLKIPAAEFIPHDLWVAANYPPMTLPERLTLVLAGFGLTYKIDEETLQVHLQRIPRAVAIDRSYRTRVNVQVIIPVLKKEYPGAFIRGEDKDLRVRATIEDHWAINAYLNPSSQPKLKDGEQVYSLAVKEQPLGKLVEQIAERLGVTVKFGEGARLLTDERVSFTVTNVTLEELFQAAVRPANLSATLEDNVVTIE